MIIFLEDAFMSKCSTNLNRITDCFKGICVRNRERERERGVLALNQKVSCDILFCKDRI